MHKTLREKMFDEMQDKAIFNQAKDFAFDYADNALNKRVFPSPDELDDLVYFVEDMPQNIGNASNIVDQLNRYGSPATVANLGGRYFGLVNGGVIPASLAARWLADFWDQNAVLYSTSPIVSKLEEVVESWLNSLFDLPKTTAAGFVSGTSMAIFCGLAAARYRITRNNNWDINSKGLNGAPKIRIVAGRHIHGAVIKAIALLGFGIDNIEWVDADDQGRIISSSLPELDQNCIVLLQAGNVNSGSFDPFDEICEKANQVNAWVHIDGAFGLWAAASEKLKHFTRGIGKANSWSVDGHKTLNTPYDSGILLCADREALVHALHASGAYLEKSEHRDGMMFTPEMSRRARVVELWAALKYLGREGTDELVFGLHERAVQFSQELEACGFQILNDVVFNQVLVACNNDVITKQTIENIQNAGECWVGGSEWFGKAVIRISVCSWVTTKEDVTRSVKAFVVARDSI